MPAEERVIEPDVVVVASGPGPDVAVPDGGTVIAADGGLDRAAALGLEVDVLVGDLDSVSSAALARAESAGRRIVRHPVAKDAADLELALDEALALGARRVLVIASAGGRLDHLAASLLLLGAERYAELELDALVGETLGPGSTRGVSNVFTSAEARVTLAEGILLAIRLRETAP